MRVVLALALALWLLPVVGRAQDAVAFAQQRYLRGVELYDARQFEPARAEFAAALELYASPNSRLYLARCLAELGQLADAALAYEQTVFEAGDRARLDPRYAPTHDAAAEELREIEPRIGRLTVTVRNMPPGARVRVGGRAVPPAALGLAVPVMPGVVEVRVEQDARALATAQARVAAGARAAVTLDAAAAPASPSGRGAAEPAPLAGRPRDDRARVAPPAPGVPASVTAARVVAISAVGLGVAAFAAAGGFWAAANTQYDAAFRACGPRACSDPAIATGQTFETLTNVGIVAGASLVAAGVLAGALFGRAPAAPSHPPRAASVRVTAGGAWLGLAGAF